MTAKHVSDLYIDDSIIDKSWFIKIKGKLYILAKKVYKVVELIMSLLFLVLCLLISVLFSDTPEDNTIFDINSDDSTLNDVSIATQSSQTSTEYNHTQSIITDFWNTCKKYDHISEISDTESNTVDYEQTTDNESESEDESKF